MTVKECYQQLGGDYNTALRIIGKESRIDKVLRMLPRDENMRVLRLALEQPDYDAAFRAAHSLKGVFLNLCLSRQAGAAAALTEALRRPPSAEIPALFEILEQSYAELLRAVETFSASESGSGDENEKKK